MSKLVGATAARAFVLGFLLSIVCIGSVSGQKKGKQKEPKYGDVEAWEWAVNDYKGDTSVGAVYLFDIAKHEWNSQASSPSDLMNTARHYRVKVLSVAAADELSNVAITYNPNAERIGKLKAHALERMPSGEVIRHELEAKDVIDDKAVRTRYGTAQRIKRFSIPKVKPGTIIEVSYIRQGAPFAPPRWYFQSSYPNLHSVLTYTRPDAIFINETFYGKVDKMLREVTQAGAVNLGVKTYTLERIVYQLDSVPAFEEFNYMHAESNYLSGVDVNVTDIRLGTIDDEKLANSWYKISRDLQKDKNFFNEEERGEPLVKETAARLQDPDTLKTIRNVYEFLKNEIKTLRPTDIKPNDDSPTSVKALLKAKAGSEPLKIATGLRLFGIMGYDPAVVFIRSREAGVIQQKFPELGQFDRLALVLSTSKTDYLLDVSETPVPFNMLPKECFNDLAWLVSAEEERFIKLPMLFSDDHNVVVNGKLTTTGTFNGEFSARFTGYGAMDARSAWKAAGSQRWLRSGIFESSRGLSFNDAKADTTLSLDEPVAASGKIELKEFSNDVDGELYFNPILVKRLNDNPLKQEKREWPIEFDSRFNHSYLINIELPEGFVPAELPKNVRIALPDRAFEFVRLINVAENRLSVSVKFINRLEVYAPELYPALRDFMTKVVSAMQEEIILKPAK